MSQLGHGLPWRPSAGAAGPPQKAAAPASDRGCRGRDEDCSSPPAQIPACAANAPGSSLGSNVGGKRIEPICGPAHRCQSDRRGNSAQCPNHGRLSAFPLGEALPSTTSAGSCLPLFGRFLGTTTSSDFSSAYMLGVRPLPSRAGPAQVRARVRPPRFRNFSTCTRSPTARGSSHASQYAMGRCCLLFDGTRSAPRN